LLIGLKNQLAKIHNASFNTSHYSRNLGFIFDEHLIFSDQITSLSKACYYNIRQLRCIRPYLDSSTACTIATSIVHSKLITVILSTINSLNLNPVSSRSRTLLLVYTVVKAPKSCHIPSYALSTRSESLNESNKSSSHLPTKFSQQPNLHTFY